SRVQTCSLPIFTCLASIISVFVWLSVPSISILLTLLTGRIAYKDITALIPKIDARVITRFWSLFFLRPLNLTKLLLIKIFLDFFCFFSIFSYLNNFFLFFVLFFSLSLIALFLVSFLLTNTLSPPLL